MPDYGRVPNGLMKLGCTLCGGDLVRRRDGHFQHVKQTECNDERTGGPTLWYMPDDQYQETARALGW